MPVKRTARQAEKGTRLEEKEIQLMQQAMQAVPTQENNHTPSEFSFCVRFWSIFIRKRLSTWQMAFM